MSTSRSVASISSSPQVVPLADLGTSRDRLRELLLPRQPRLHFRDERDARKHRIISAVLELDVRADIYVADLVGVVVDARRRCLTALAASALTRHPSDRH